MHGSHAGTSQTLFLAQPKAGATDIEEKANKLERLQEEAS
jgi:hypothetical protein